ncbi:MAG: DUF1588 domain-containing protein [Halieaceae bacterium]|jgi:cytochrome c553|nr:DUF1588 domain-containing protein [Halieaceae bacterium]
MISRLKFAIHSGWRRETRALQPAGSPSVSSASGVITLAAVALLASAPDIHAQTKADYYTDNVAPYAAPCMACHLPNGIAAQQKSSLFLAGLDEADAAANYEGFENYLALPGANAASLLAKVAGGDEHGGGLVHAQGSAGYRALAELASFIESGVADGGGVGGGAGNQDFWRGLVLEPRERTLRRASLLLGGVLPKPGQIKAAKKSDAKLRKQVLQAMKGDAFHEFLITGADDRLHTLGFTNGFPSEFGSLGVYPETNIVADLKSCAEATETGDPAVYIGQLNQCNYGYFLLTLGLTREPLELIAHVVERNLNYKQVLTANYTVANRALNDMYEGGNSFPPLKPNEAISLTDVHEYRRSRDRGQPDYRDPFEFACDDDGCLATKVGRQINRPHAGVLTTPAFLARYFSTDTNRNRARARWTYLHFLGIDIENSAPRSTDPVALADTDNPTLKNPACTVCHERLDPLAGTFQNFGDFGDFRPRGTHALADTYTNPEWFGGMPGDTEYRPGDTWYRDMRAPGLEQKKAPNNNNSLSWLAKQIANDPRFARATVMFWWPAIMGKDPIEQPMESGDPNYAQQLAAFNAQQELIDSLATQFRKKGFKAKQLFADMILSDWFRAEGFEVADGENRDLELADVGAGRLLTPEELDRKNRALFGAFWNESNTGGYTRFRTLMKQSETYLAYGGIDSDAIRERSRQLTPLMSNVAELMAVQYACLVPVWDFNPKEMNQLRAECAKDKWYEQETASCGLAPPEVRSRLFTRVKKTTVPNAANRAKIENQLVDLYQHMFGLTVTRRHADIQALYGILEDRHAEFKKQGTLENNCWIGNDEFSYLLYDEGDPQGMVRAWGSVVRAMMSHFLYLHE